jgi:hypothetical protein
MKVVKAVTKVQKGILTCADVIEILAYQPTSVDQAKSVVIDDKKGNAKPAHAHMHTRDGFSPEKQNSFTDARWEDVQKDWSSDAHIDPLVTMSGSGLRMAPERIAHGNHYRNRTGIVGTAGTPAQHEYTISAVGHSGAPYVVGKVYVGSDPLFDGKYQGPPIGGYAIPPGSNALISKRTKENHVAAVPCIYPTGVHSVFEDSESMVMHLTAALSSKAGIKALNALSKKIDGKGDTVGIFSLTAVKAVSEHVTKISAKQSPIKMVDRAQKHIGNVPSAGHTDTKRDINHICVVLSKDINGQLVIFTCFPTAKTVGESVDNNLLDMFKDVYEPSFGTHNQLEIDLNLPSIVWSGGRTIGARIQCSSCDRIHGWSWGVFRCWHRCSLCGTIYCPTCGKALRGKTALYSSTRECEKTGCGGRTELLYSGSN